MGMQLVCRTEDVPPNGMKRCEMDDGVPVLIANSGDQYFAYQAICPHQEVELCEGFYDGRVLTCHQHLWQWDIRTGAAIGLAEAPLERFDVKVQDGCIYVGIPSALDVAPLFEAVSGSMQAALAAIARRQTFAEGSTIYDFGDPAEDLYVLESGRVEFALGRDERTSPGGFMLRKGEVFGWAALLEDQPRRIARATCREPSSLLVLNGNAVREILRKEPESGYLVMKKLAELVTRYLASAGAK